MASVEGETFTAKVVARAQQLNERELDKQHRLVTAQALDRVGQQRLIAHQMLAEIYGWFTMPLP